MRPPQSTDLDNNLPEQGIQEPGPLGLTPGQPLVFDGPRSDCWYQCTEADVLSGAARRWLQQAADGVRTQFESFLNLTWCALPLAAAADRSTCGGCLITACGAPNSSQK